MNRSQAAELLSNYAPDGVIDDGSAEAIRTAFAMAVKWNHPDQAETTSGPLIKMAALKEARDVLLEHVGAKPVSACPYCRGTGWQSIGFKPTPCIKGCAPEA
jgi:hypothetical protein